MGDAWGDTEALAFTSRTGARHPENTAKSLKDGARQDQGAPGGNGDPGDRSKGLAALWSASLTGTLASPPQVGSVLGAQYSVPSRAGRGRQAAPVTSERQGR